MLKEYTAKQRRHLEMYFRCLSSTCIRGLLGNYYVAYEFEFSNLYLRRGLIKHARQLWDIEDVSSFQSRIHWLLEDSNRVEYRSMHARLSALSESGRSKYLEAHKEHEDFGKLKVVAQGQHQMPSGDISAYGLAWVIYLSRIGYIEDYLTKAEAWEYKIEAARQLQERYSSWADYYIAYSLGDSFSSMRPHGANHLFDAGLNKLMKKSTILYRQAAWAQNLLPETN